jgi:adenylate kinase family enzyme
VPQLSADDPLPARPTRVLVGGTSGSGKTTLAGIIAAVLGCPRIELDALHHGPGWTPRPEFSADVDRFSSGSEWVTEFQYAAVRDLLLERADLFVWLDLPRPVVMRSVIRRTLTRRLRRETLWNGNQEPPLRTFLTDPDHIVRWAWRKHGPDRLRLGAVAAGRPDLPVVRLTTRAEVARWIAGPLHRAAR